ncbi:glyoxalase superfamily protein [Deinococcus soli (ex Cha et al. 2016)]|uniref:Uncharacterized protein n=2 Tax=Deinococcus soli (ex Cha et al. 2016) TaxID=1309411 RepID=A0ACC6KKI6_9DEIO|nr:glyoxalase superfamily protein [Deinococcus soli (ex Cha et al. 2016)]MDR6218635.1 hypothetical protein [Deinococcus soli (ex Cha et al. 2016)]MDR6328432.1 hypothetical protein [Deinococcus soli (ex Cha et al. 2016)]MDR6753043.1 hypothetical protein [Deinococcus soli (ex Cha et al. 2016)]
MSTDLKAHARRLAAALKRAGHPVNHTTALHLVAQERGFENWHALLAAQASTPPVKPVRVMIDLSGGTWGEIIADGPAEILLIDDDFTQSELNDRGASLTIGTTEYIYTHGGADIDPDRIEEIFADLNATPDPDEDAEECTDLVLSPALMDVYATPASSGPLGQLTLTPRRAGLTRPWVAHLPAAADAPWLGAHAGQFCRVSVTNGRATLFLTDVAAPGDIPS